MGVIKVDGKPVYDKINTQNSKTGESAGVVTKLIIDDDGMIKEISSKSEGSIAKAKDGVDKEIMNKLSSAPLANDWRIHELEKAREKMLEVENYNKTLFETTDSNLKNMILLGNKVLIRLFKLQRYDKHGFYVGGRKIEKMSKSELNKTLVEAPEETQYQEKGVVIKVGEGCSEQFKSLVKPGDIVDIDPTSFNPRNQRWIQKTTIHESYDNYFMVQEFNIEFVESK